MKLRRMTPAFLAATVALTGVTGAFLSSMVPAHAITSVDELSDVNRNHWAFDALRDLVEKYDVIEGYPDLTFKGNKAPTRYEMAAALNALIKTIGRDLARLGAEKADKRDLQTLARLQEEFRNELNALSARTKALEDRAAAIEAKNDEQDNRLTLLEKTQIHGDFSFGLLSDISAQGVDTNRGNDDGIGDGISGIARLRLALDIPVKEETEDSKVGRGDVYTRLIAAMGRNAPSGGSGGNAGGIGTFSGYSRIAGDADQYNDGFLASSNQNNRAGGNSRQNLYVETAYYKQNFKEGIPLLTDFFGVFPDKEGYETTGDLYLGVIPWRFLYDKSAYRGNELSQFQNPSLVNTPGIPVNLSTPTVAYQWHQGLGDSFNLDLTTGLASISNGDLMDGLNLTYEARLNYISDFLGDDWAKPGSLYAGGYHIWQAGNTLTGFAGTGTNRTGGISAAQGNGAAIGRGLADNGTSSGFYAGWNQEWFRGIGTFVNYALNDRGSGNFLFNSNNQTIGAGNTTGGANGLISLGSRQALSAGLQIPMSAIASNWRENDVLGIGYAMIDLHEQSIGDNASSPQDFGLDDAWEQVLEVYYKYQFTDSITVVPSAQFIFNRMGLDDNDFTTLLGVRTNYLF